MIQVIEKNVPRQSAQRIPKVNLIVTVQDAVRRKPRN